VSNAESVCEVRMRRVGRIVRLCLITLLLMFLAICTTGEIRQRILVHRAASLLSDIHSLRLHQSNWNDAQRLRARWDVGATTTAHVRLKIACTLLRCTI
jgi:hypothetical protein